ncbi:MAG: PTS sugar transporter subunit IIA [bacterium]
MSNTTLEEPVQEHNGKRGRMQRILNQLVQLQDLIFARDQQEASMPGTRLTQLDSAIQAMTQDLPPDTVSQFQKIQKKGTLAIVPISNGVCSACGMAIPVSQVHAVHAGDLVYQCPSCTRFLIYPVAPPRRVGKRRRRSEPAQIGICRFSSAELMIPNLQATDRDDAVAEMCMKLEDEGFVDNGARLLEEALKREAIVSTAVDHGLAFPHVRGVEGGGLTLALALSRKGVKFGGPGRSATKIIFFMVIPTAVSAFYLKLLSGLTQAFREEDAREALAKAETSEDLWKALIKATRTTVP